MFLRARSVKIYSWRFYTWTEILQVGPSWLCCQEHGHPEPIWQRLCLDWNGEASLQFLVELSEDKPKKSALMLMELPFDPKHPTPGAHLNFNHTTWNVDLKLSFSSSEWGTRRCSLLKRNQTEQRRRGAKSHDTSGAADHPPAFNISHFFNPKWQARNRDRRNSEVFSWSSGRRKEQQRLVGWNTDNDGDTLNRTSLSRLPTQTN